MTTLVTGANGFMGNALCRRFLADGARVRGVVHRRREAIPDGLETVVVGDLGPDTDWRDALKGTETVIHLAARVHQADDASRAAWDDCHAANTLGTLRLARQAVEAGVKRFVFLSTIKVHGEETPNRPDHPGWNESDPPAPQGGYAVSKWLAEQALTRLADESGLEVVVMRPPLVYGAGVKANFLRLMQAVDRGVPLPLGAVHNRRSLVYSGNLAEAILLASRHPAAAGKCYLVSDGEPVSTPELIRSLAREFRRPARLLPVPPDWIAWLGGLFARKEAVNRLLGSLVVDDAVIRRELAWRPSRSLQEGLSATVNWYRQRSAS
ncbi:N-acetyl-alpha-D-glucosaminyl-diphospho-ditrans, octacis-undecaprenol 4-epimerase [Candidatus Magnetaquicoccaceae bacterium FCR-1]|uniref:N-acetyl-alpha-D-glucosaminyl-diphospho-ditrans, octacis-undecaprenol 4-epimerase n=1 Tax=Candidatus Magnetaquiglobus chichijimensis TaxID=3141448 RepID=A0ABQ0C9K4_9PROT